MRKRDESQDRELQSIFENSGRVPLRDTNAAANGRAMFLKQAQELSRGVSPGEKRRHNKWFKSIPKERFAMLTTILVIVGLLFGSSGATVFAAQNSMPGEFLYPVKGWSETVRSDLTNSPEARYELMLQLAEQRTEEIRFLAQNGAGNGEQQIERLQLHLDDALQQTTRLQDQDMLRALTQIRDRLHQQDQTMQQALQQTGPQGQAILERARQTLRTQERLADNGLTDPQAFRLREQTQEQQRQGQPHATTAPIDDPEAVVESAGDAQILENPWTTGTPTPGSGYGEGSGGNPWTDTTPTPGSGYGEGSGGNPWTDTTPTPGSGYGPGPGTGGTCTNDCDGIPNPNPGNPDNGGAGSGTGGGGPK